MLSVIVPTPYKELHCVFTITGTSTSCRVPGDGRDTGSDMETRHSRLGKGTLPHYNTLKTGKGNVTQLRHTQDWERERYLTTTHSRLGKGTLPDYNTLRTGKGNVTLLQHTQDWERERYLTTTHSRLGKGTLPNYNTLKTGKGNAT